MAMTDTPPAAVGPEKYISPYHVDPDNFEAEFNKVPLFMDSLPDEENDAVAALQSLMYDGTPEEIAENFKNQGNDCFRAGKSKYQDAVTFYTQAIDTDCSDKKLMEDCYTNRAAVNLKLGNYGRALRDCAESLKLNPTNVKALFRSASALLAIDKLDEASDCCEHGLRVDPNNAPILELQRTCKARIKEIEDRIRAKEEKARKELEKKAQLKQALQTRNITMVLNDREVYEKAGIQYDAETDTLRFPVFFLYPEYKESDYIQQFGEHDTLMDHLTTMFECPAPWDTAHAYTASSVEVYFENNEGARPRLLKVGKKLTLGKILALEQYVVTNGIPSFIILPKKSPAKDTFLAKYKQ